jgi:hypothetical protein
LNVESVVEQTYLADEVLKLAEFFTMMDIDNVPFRDMVRQNLMQYPKDTPKELLGKIDERII